MKNGSPFQNQRRRRFFPQREAPFFLVRTVKPDVHPKESSPGEPPFTEASAEPEPPPKNEVHASPPIPQFQIPVHFTPIGDGILNAFQAGALSPLKEDQASRSIIRTFHIQSSFDELLCLNAIRDVERYWYQIETAKKVLKYFRGRALLV